jgi:hypothetical protein
MFGKQQRLFAKSNSENKQGIWTLYEQTSMKIEDINDIEDAENFILGTLYDFESGIIDKDEAVKLLSLYTTRITELCWEAGLNN